MNSADGYDLMGRLDRLDARAAGWMARHGVLLLRASLGVVFLWFGALKLFPGLSPAEGLAGQTIWALTNGAIEPAISVPVLGVWESLIGVGLLTGKALRLTLVALLVHMCGTVTPLVLFPSEMFVREPFVLTMEAQYIIKNLVFVSASLVVGATVRGRSGHPRADRSRTTAASTEMADELQFRAA
jgi:uncharacterized membrane protein YphA (DoxX/SURF4 family)